MAQIVVAAAGAAVGFMVGGPTGAKIGWAVGSMVGSTFGPTQKAEGPRLSDLSVSNSEYGSTIPYIAGHPRISGQIVWASTKREIATTQRQGKGGGGGSEVTTYTYEIDLLIVLTSNVIENVTRIWSDGELVYNGTIKNSLCTRISTYTGQSNQLPDPTYESAVGSNNATAYRGRGSVFIESLQLGSSGRIPNLTFEAATQSVDITDDSLLLIEGLLGAPTDISINNRAIVTADYINHFSVAGRYLNYTIGPQSIDDYNSAYVGGVGEYLRASSIAGSATYETLFTLKRIPGASNILPSTHYLGTLFSVRIGDGNEIRLRSATGGSTEIFVFEGANVFFSATIPVVYDQLIHVAVVVDTVANQIRGYYNGALVGTKNGIAPQNLGEICQATIGTYGGGIHKHEGTYAEYRGLRVRREVLYSGASFTIPNEFSSGPVLVYTPEDVPVKDTVDNILARTGMTLAQYDTTDLSSIVEQVRGLAVSQISTTRTLLEILATAYHFDIVLSDKLYFKRRTSAPIANFAIDDLGYHTYESTPLDPLPIIQFNELEIPAQMAITYSSVEGDYQSDTQYSDRLLTGMESLSNTELPLVLTAADAKRIANSLLFDKAAGIIKVDIQTNNKYASIEPTDVILINSENIIGVSTVSYRFRVIKRTDKDNFITLSCLGDNSDVFIQEGLTDGGTVSQSVITQLPSTEILLLDIPLLREEDNTSGFYIASKAEYLPWPGVAIYDSYDNVNYSFIDTINSSATMGVCSSILGNWNGGDILDEVNSVTVDIGYQELTSVERSNLIEDQTLNMALIGNELLQFQTAELLSTGIYKLSSFIRGRRDTRSIGHIASEKFVLISGGGVKFFKISTGAIGKLKYYKGTTISLPLTNTTETSIVPMAVPLKPFAPINARATRDTPDTLVTWTRQTRLDPRFLGLLGQSNPLGEVTEAYSIEIYSTNTYSTVRRTALVSSPEYLYTQADQIADFGSVQTVLYIKVYQLSATIGRGNPLTTQV